MIDIKELLQNLSRAFAPIAVMATTTRKCYRA